MAAPAGNMADGLMKLVSDIAKLATAPDADLDFLTKLQMIITDYMRSGGGEASQTLSSGPNQAPGAALVGAAGGSGAMGGAMQGLGGAGGPGMPNTDELRRMLGGSGGQGGGL